MGYNSVADNTDLTSLVYLLLSPKYEKCREIPREFDLTAAQGHPRSSINGKLLYDFLLVIVVTLAISATVFNISTLKDRKLLILPTPPLFDTL